MSRYFTVGIANDPQPVGKYYRDEQEAIQKANEMAEAYGFNTAIAVWDDKDEPYWLFMLGEVFMRMK